MAEQATTAATGWDVLGIGSATIDEFLVVERYPAEDSKAEVVAVDRQGGGLIATALVAAARLGVRAAYADLLGTDELTAWIERDLQAEGIDVSLVGHHPAARPIHAYIVVSQSGQSRTIIYSMAGQQRYPDDYPPLAAVRATKVLLVDDVSQLNLERIKATVREARRLHIPVVGDFEKEPDFDLLDNIDHLLISQSYAERLTGTRDPAVAAVRLWREDRAAVVITCGAEGCWYRDDDGTPCHLPAFAVPVVDTTGCGDVFHGAYAAGLRWGWATARRVRFASACAALKTRALGGRRGIPTLAEVEAFLAQHPA